MKIHRIVLLVALILPTALFAQQTFVNPGFHLGYRFGEGGGFVGGVEVSFVRLHNRDYSGVVLAWDAVGGMNNFHAGFEYGSGFFGACVGPVLVTGNNGSDFGLRITPYGGVLLVPYYSFQLLRTMPNTHEVGMFLKVAVQTGGGPVLGRIGG